MLRVIIEGTASSTGDVFFQTLVEYLAKAIGTNHAFVSEFTPPQRIRTLAFWSGGKIVPNIEYDLPGTPCQEVIDGGFCFYRSGLQKKYPETEPGIESYLGVPLIARDGRIVGHLCALDESPMPHEKRRLDLFHIFAARAASELDRIRMDTELRDQELRLRDLFEEAPIAYVHETLESRFIRANRAALKILGVKPEEVPHMVGKLSLIHIFHSWSRYQGSTTRLDTYVFDRGAYRLVSHALIDFCSLEQWRRLMRQAG